MEALVIAVVFLLAWFVIGRIREKSHLRSLAEREAANSDILVTNMENLPEGMTAESTSLCIGSACIAPDGYQHFVARLCNIIGGRVGVLQSVMSRSRREAKLRMIEQAKAVGAQVIIGLRYETATIMGGKQGQRASAAEVLAYGTAVKLRP